MAVLHRLLYEILQYLKWYDCSIFLFPEIEMSSVKVHINQGPATLRCKILDYDFYPGQITIYHKHENNKEHPIYTLINETDTHSIGFQNTKTNRVITHTSENYTLELALKFNTVLCDDTGMYICELISHGIKYSARGYLHGFGKIICGQFMRFYYLYHKLDGML